MTINSLRFAVFFSLSLIILLVVLSGSIVRAQSTSPLPIVPGLAGFGATTPAGSGRHNTPAITKVFRVTHLQANGRGSLQECIYASGPRTCVFEVSGTIDLSGDKSYDGSSVINLKHPFITIAGQTAPSPGITVKGKTLRIEAHDVLIQHIRFRVGDASDVAIDPAVRDTILIAGNHSDADRTPHNIVIDHCSVSWGVDEVVSIKDGSHHITLSNNIISEGLDRSLHPKGRHSKGLMAVGNYQTLYRNLFANLRDRAPLDVSPNSVLVNNLSHNSKYASFWALSRSGYYADKDYRRKTALIANVRIRGADTSDRRQNVYAKASKDIADNAEFYLRDNLCADEHQDLISCGVENIKSLTSNAPSIANEGMDIWPAVEVKDRLLNAVGARPKDRDTVDQRLIQQVSTNTGTVPNCVSAAEIFYPIGKLARSSQDSVSIALEQCHPDRFEGQSIDLWSDGGQVQRRTITQHNCRANTFSDLQLDRPLSGALSASSNYRVVNNCDNNAGGWPVLKKNKRSLDLPSQPGRIMPSGYTALEELLHDFANTIEGRS